MAQVNKIVERLDQHLAPVVSPFRELAPNITQVNILLEQLTVESMRTHRPAPVVPPRPQPRAVPTPETPSNQRTIIQFLVKRSDIGTCKEAQPISPGESRRSDGSDTPPTGTPPSEFVTPGGQSPETVDEGSTDKAETLLPWSREATSNIFSRINTLKYVRLVELKEQERADLTERQGNGGSTDEVWRRV